MGSPIITTRPLGFPWETADPFLFCVHHDDAYPAGEESMGPPKATLKGRNIGMDFEVRDGWRMYHGDTVPGFPRHPHRGFETITVARRGFIDHSDSLGATGRFGQGDVQWMTAGKGIVHAEMFPLLKKDSANPTELFQIWLNLPKADKMVDPYYTMLWNDDIPRHTIKDDKGSTEVTVIAGALEGAAAPLPPPPNSWAAREKSEVVVWTVRMTPGATWQPPPGPAHVHRTFYFFRGADARFNGDAFKSGSGLQVKPNAKITIVNGNKESEFLVLQGMPIGEPVVQHGPFVMNTRDEIVKAITDYQRTQFGGWPWKQDAPVHARDAGRFAKHSDGRVEKKT